MSQVDPNIPAKRTGQQQAATRAEQLAAGVPLAVLRTTSWWEAP